MTNEEKEILTTKEAASLLDVKPSTIHKYINEGKLKPVYEKDWNIDATKLFYKEDIENLKRELIKPGITTGEAAELLNLHPATIALNIQKGLLRAEKKLYMGRLLYFIKPEEIERFKSESTLKRRREQKDFYDKETGFAWFQSFTNLNGNSNNRILLDEDGDPYLFTESGQKIDIKRIGSEGYSPVKSIPVLNYVTRRGLAKFIFESTEFTYSIIELFYQHLGPKNMKIKVNRNKKIHVEIKPIYLKTTLTDSLIRELKLALIEGSITEKLDGVFINSGLESITVPVPAELKELIIDYARKNEQTLEEVVLSALKIHFDF